MIFSPPPHLQIHFGTKHLLLPPLQSAPLPITHRNEDRFRCGNTEETRETHYCFALEKGRKKSKSSFRSEGSQTPEGPDEEGRLLSLCECCWVPIRRPHVFTAVGKEWRLDLLLPSSLDTRVTQWLGWARSLPHSHPLFFALLLPRLSHHYLYCSGWVNVEESSLFDSCDKEVCKLKHSEQSSPQMLPAALCSQSVDSNPWNS